MALVICDGVQYDDRRLPEHVNPKRCVPAEEWFRQNRTGAPTPEVEPTEEVAPSPARPARSRSRKS